MTARSSTGAQGMPDRFDYFMVRVTRTGDDVRLAGLVERLGTGEKRGFTTGQQLLELVADWSDVESNLQAPSEPSNPGEGHD